MRGLIAAPLIAIVAVIGPSSVDAQSPPYGAQPIDVHCRSDWSTREKWGNTLGMTWPQFLTYCRTHTGAWSAEGSPNGPASTQAAATAETKSHHTKHPKQPTVQPASTPASQ